MRGEAHHDLGGGNAKGLSSEKSESIHTFRIDIEKLDVMLNLTGEIAIAQGRLQRLLSHMGEAGEQAAEVQEEITHRHFWTCRSNVMKI